MKTYCIVDIDACIHHAYSHLVLDFDTNLKRSPSLQTPSGTVLQVGDKIIECLRDSSQFVIFIDIHPPITLIFTMLAIAIVLFVFAAQVPTYILYFFVDSWCLAWSGRCTASAA